MLAPIRDYLSPKDPMSAPLLCLTKERYFSRLSVDVCPGGSGFQEARWIVSEDVNVEYLLDTFTTMDATSDSVWNAFVGFMKHLSWHRPRLITLGQKIEALSDDHPSKQECLFHLSRLLHRVGNHTERKRLLTHALKLAQEHGDDHGVARTLRQLSNVHSWMRLFKEGIQQAKEASDIYKRLGDTVEQAQCLIALAWLLHCDKQLDDAEEAASRAIALLPEKGEHRVCRCHHILGNIYLSKGDTERAVCHLEVALRLASSFHWLNLLVWIHFSLADMCCNQGKFYGAHAHVER